MSNLRRSFLTRLGIITGAGAAVAASGGSRSAMARTAADTTAERVVSITEYEGLDPTGRNPSDAAFTSAVRYVASLARKSVAGENPNMIGNKRIVLPPGTYKLTRPGALLDSSLFTARTQGLTIEGDGPPGSVVLLYEPKGPGALMKNHDKALVVRFRNIQFHGKAPDNDLIDSASAGGAQDYAFDDCIFTGNWRYGANLIGENCNSEWKFWRCAWAGTWKTFLYVGRDNTSDQFLNYWFDHCKYWSSSNWITLERGGNVKLTDCDVSGYEPGAPTFLFNLRGNNHAQGVCSFKAEGLRVEQKSRHAGLIHCEWEQGNVGFKDCDFSSQGYQPFAAGTVSAVFSPGNTAGAQVVFDNCQIMGRHQYTTGQGPWGQGRATYRNCDFLNYTHPDEALMFSEPGNQLGRRRVVTLEGCRGNCTGGVFADAEIGWHVAASATVRTKMISFKNAFGRLPASADGVQTVVLPMNAIVMRVILDVPPGAAGSAGQGTYTIQTGESTPTVLATLRMQPFSAGGQTDQRIVFRCSTRQRCTLSLVPGAGTDQSPGGGAVALVEYIG
ncbi:hypothetical protein [Cupriavidus sp. RAF12]|uniref:hypothetical protein n=1 Tax=Cupriavidus sp. RAF12 TaxID=3233050 RepID=UPI003F90BB25